MTKVELSERRGNRRCAYCHGDDDPIEIACDRCGTLLHAECRKSVSRCPTLECPGLDEAFAKEARELESQKRIGARRTLYRKLLAVLLLWLSVSYLSSLSTRLLTTTDPLPPPTNSGDEAVVGYGSLRVATDGSLLQTSGSTAGGSFILPGGSGWSANTLRSGSKELARDGGTTLVEIDLPDGALSGTIAWQVSVTDGTDVQIAALTEPWQAVVKDGHARGNFTAGRPSPLTTAGTLEANLCVVTQRNRLAFVAFWKSSLPNAKATATWAISERVR